VKEKSPIADALPGVKELDDDDDDDDDDEIIIDTTSSSDTNKKKFGDQLDWWERMGIQ